MALQRLDGAMALDICLKLFDEAVPVLPVHDSFICRIGDVGRVEEVMDGMLQTTLRRLLRDGIRLP